MKTTLEEIIEKLDSRKHTLSSGMNVKVIDAMIVLLKLHLPKERQRLKSIFRWCRRRTNRPRKTIYRERVLRFKI